MRIPPRLFAPLSLCFFLARAVFAQPFDASPVDFDTNGIVDVRDLVRLVSHVNAVNARLSGGPDLLPPALAPYADVNEDGLLNEADVNLVADVILGLPLFVKPPAPVALVPASGSSEVGVTVRPKAIFPKPINTATLNSNNFFASFSGRKLPANIVPAENGTFAWLYFHQPMPNAAQVQVTVDGSTILTRRGAVLDADGDGTPGGTARFNFSTVSVVPIPGAVLAGRIVDPGPDLRPFTADDFSPGPDGLTNTTDDVFLRPIAGVQVFVLGMEDRVVTTGADGRFRLDPVPVGNVKLAIDGRTASTAHPGFYWPEMVMDTHFAPGVTNFAMMGMETMHLPRLASNILQTVFATDTTMITLQSNAAYTLPPEQQQYLTVEVMPGSLIGMDGQPLASGQVGVSVVPPELVEGMLPPGLLKHTFDITVQAPGISTFATPAPMTFPNVFNAPPGTRLNFLSFDHTTGRLVIEGTATVSEDGLFVRTDPGTGITHPGWHGLTPPGMMIDPITGQPCRPPGWSQSDTDVLVGRIQGILGIIGAVGPLGEALTGEGTRARGFFGRISGAGTVFDLGNCLSASGAGGVAACGRFVAGIGLMALPLARLPRLIIAAESAAEAAAAFHQAAEKVRALKNLPPCDPNQAAAAVADAETLAQLLDGVAGQAMTQLPVIRGMEGDAGGLQRILVRIDPLLPYFGLPMEDYNELIRLSLDYGRAGAQIDANGFFLITLVTILHRLPILLHRFFDSSADLALIETVPVQSRGCPVSWVAEFDGTVLRGTSRSISELEVFGPAEQPVRMGIYFPSLHQLHVGGVVTGPSGGRTNILMIPSTLNLADSDGDGLGDDEEFVLGTNPHNPDSDGDGINDFAEVQQCLNPLDNRGFPSGVIVALPLPGVAKEVVVEGSTANAALATAYVALGSRGLGIVNVSQFQMPILLGQIDLPGDATDVAVDAALGIAVVAANAGGLHLVDVSNPMLPVLRRTLNAIASQVETVGGVAYAAVGTEVRSYDLATGELIQTLPLGGGTITGLSCEGLFLYTLDTGRRLRAIDLGSGDMDARGSLVLPAGNGKLFVGGGVAYAAAESGFNGGFVTASVTNPDSLALLSGVDANNVAGARVVPNGSGLAVAVGSPGNLGNVIDVLNVSDPANTGGFLTRFFLPADPFSVAIGAGIAFIADGTAGLQVVNYRSFDNLGVPPTITLGGTLTFTSPTNAVIEEGSFVRLAAVVTDDVQVRSVEFFIDGTNVVSDVSFPFEHRFIAPALAAGRTNFFLRARATDTGGNAAWTPEIVVTLAPDFTPPRLRRPSPATNAIADVTDSIFAFFTEPIDAGLLSTDTFSLTWAGPDHRLGTPDDAPVTNAVVSLRETLRATVFTATNGLPQGFYRARLAATLADRAGNALTNSFEWTFWLLRGGAEGDADSDGITNHLEIRLAFDPVRSDTDGDGWDDGVELAESVASVTNALLRPRLTFASAPPVLTTLPGPEELGLPGVATTVARPPVLATLPGHEEMGLVGTGVTLGQPPILVTLPGTEELGFVGIRVSVANPPVLVALPGAEELGEVGNAAAVARPPVLITLPAGEELGVIGNGALLARPPLVIAHTNMPPAPSPLAGTNAPKPQAQLNLKPR